ncbi:MAG: hypothetical protein ACJ79X_12915 [Gemmatimonadaceae bacterium]
MKIPFCCKAAAAGSLAILLMTACGSDSTGPTSLDAASALKSLSIGLNGFGGVTPAEGEANEVFDAMAPSLSKVNVTLDGASQNMYALGLRESFPAGTCEENVFVDPQFPPTPGVCTPPSLGVAIILWQSHSASEAPDKLILVATDVGAGNFDLAQDNPPIAIYIQDQDKLFASESGSLTTQVTAGGQSCNVPLPPYAKSGTCTFSTFNAQGSVVLSEFTLNGSSAGSVTLGIPAMTLNGLWINITEVQAVPATGIRVAASRALSRLMSTAVAATLVR